MKPAAAASALKVQAALGPDFQVLEFDASTSTAEDAAAIGCAVAKSPSRSSFAQTNGARCWSSPRGSPRRRDEGRRDPRRRNRRADADFVRAKTAVLPSAAYRRSVIANRRRVDRRRLVCFRGDLGGGWNAQRRLPPDSRRSPAPDRRNQGVGRALSRRPASATASPCATRSGASKTQRHRQRDAPRRA